MTIADKHEKESAPEGTVAPARYVFATEGEFELLSAKQDSGDVDQVFVAALVGMRWLILLTYVGLGATGAVPIHPLALLGSAGWIGMTNVLATWDLFQKRHAAWYENTYLWMDLFSVFFAMLATANLGFPIWAALVMLMIEAPAEQPATRAAVFNVLAIACYPVCAGILSVAGWYPMQIGVTITATAILIFIAFNLSVSFEGNRKLRQVIRAMAITDALTGLPNRRELSRHLASPPSDGTRIAVIVMDVDRFKQYNDSYGHLAGDQLLIRLAECVRESFPDAETIARYGGDEFVILVPVTDADDLTLRVQSMQDRCVARAASVSAGVAIWPDHQPTLDSALAAADDALRETKRKQRGRFATYDAAGLIHVRTA